jgi:glycosyltransferase involved in cell wall biosynthesis
VKKILYLVPSDYDDLKEKGVLNLIKERDEGGYFDEVLTIHPFARISKIIKISETNTLLQLGWKFKNSFLNKLFVTKIVGTCLILLRLIFVLPFRLKQEKITIIRATDPYYMGLLGIFYSRLLNKPLVVTIHSDYDKRFLLDGPRGSFTILKSRGLAKMVEKFVYIHATMVLPIREYMRKNIVNEFGIEDNKTAVFPHGIDFSHFEKPDKINIYDKFNIQKEKKIISFAGRLSRENYIYDILKVAEELGRTRTDYIFLIAGNGNEFVQIKNLCNEKKMNKYVKFIGYQPKKIVNCLRKQSYISICLMGGFSLIEACASSRPVISYDIEWHSELVISGETGFLIDENNIDDVIKKTNYLFNNPALADAFGKKAYQLAFNKHEIKNTTKIKQQIYRQILNEYNKR